MSDFPTINGDPVHITWIYLDKTDPCKIHAVVNSLDTGHVYQSSEWIAYSTHEEFLAAQETVGNEMLQWLEANKD